MSPDNVLNLLSAAADRVRTAAERTGPLRVAEERPWRVLFVENDEHAAQATLRNLHRLQPSWIVHWEPALTPALRIADRFDVAILDLDLGDSGPAYTVPSFRERHPKMALVVFTGFPDPNWAYGEIVLDKTDTSADQLVKVVEAAAGKSVARANERARAAALAFAGGGR